MGERGKRIPDETREQIADAIRAGGTCRGIAHRFDVSPDTVRKIAEKAGIVDPFSRAQTQAATAAKVVDLAARRAALAEKLLDLADHISERATGRYEIILATKDDVYHEWLVEPPLPDTRQALTAVGVAIDKHIALVRFDTKDAGNAQAHSLAERLIAHLGLVDDGYDDGYPPEDDPLSPEDPPAETPVTQ